VNLAISVYVVLDSSVLINLLIVATEFTNFFEKLKKLLETEDAEIFIPQIVKKEITRKEQTKLLRNLLEDGTIKIIEINRNEIESMKRLYSFRLGSGEIAMSILVKKFLAEDKLSIGFANDKLVIKKMEREIPILHGLWFYTQMFSHKILDEAELNEIINLANKDMKLEIKELEDIKKKYLDKKASLNEIINSFLIEKL